KAPEENYRIRILDFGGDGNWRWHLERSRPAERPSKAAAEANAEHLDAFELRHRAVAGVVPIARTDAEADKPLRIHRRMTDFRNCTEFREPCQMVCVISGMVTTGFPDNQKPRPKKRKPRPDFAAEAERIDKIQQGEAVLAYLESLKH